MQWNTLIERAKEELEILEFHHPDEFASMKVELKAFIAELESQHLDLVSNTPSSSPSAATQESTSIRKTTTNRKRKRMCPVVEASNPKVKSRTDAVLERAQLCLHKIQHLKTTFF